jgi:hypothetical protein
MKTRTASVTRPERDDYEHKNSEYPAADVWLGTVHEAEETLPELPILCLEPDVGQLIGSTSPSCAWLLSVTESL